MPFAVDIELEEDGRGIVEAMQLRPVGGLVLGPGRPRGEPGHDRQHREHSYHVAPIAAAVRVTLAGLWRTRPIRHDRPQAAADRVR